MVDHPTLPPQLGVDSRTALSRLLRLDDPDPSDHLVEALCASGTIPAQNAPTSDRCAPIEPSTDRAPGAPDDSARRRGSTVSLGQLCQSLIEQ